MTPYSMISLDISEARNKGGIMDEMTTASRSERPTDQALVASLLSPVAPKTTRTRQRGSGRIFQRGAMWWIAYYVKKEGRSVEVRESAGSTEADARRALKRRQDELSAHRIGA